MTCAEAILDRILSSLYKTFMVSAKLEFTQLQCGRFKDNCRGIQRVLSTALSGHADVMYCLLLKPQQDKGKAVGNAR